MKAAAIGAIPPLALGPLLPTPWLVLASVPVGTSILQMTSVLAPAALQQVCPNEFRGQVYAVYLAVGSMLAYTVGPLAVPLITDRVFHNEMKVNWSLAIVAFLLLPLAAVAFRFAMRFARE